MTVFKDYLQWYNKKDVVPALEVLQTRIQFHQNKWIFRLKLGCSLPYQANKCPHKFENYKFYPSCQGDKDS